MSISNLEKVTYADLKKRLRELVDFDDWTDKCAVCGRPDLLHNGPCTRTEKDLPGDLRGIWTEFRKRMKTVIRWTKASKEKEKDEASLLEGLKKLMFDLTEHNTKNIETVLSALKVYLVKDATESFGVRDTTRTAMVIKPAKIPTWTKTLSLETYTKQVNTWSEINKNISQNVK